MQNITVSTCVTRCSFLNTSTGLASNTSSVAAPGANPITTDIVSIDTASLAGLEEWASHAPSEYETVQRWQVVELIQQAYQQGAITLNLAGRHLTSLPHAIGQLSSLQVLNLSANEFTQLPESITQLTNLEQLILNYTPLTELPPDIGVLVNLQELDLTNTSLEHLPDSIGQLSRLVRLKVSQTPLLSVPDTIGHLTGLQWLDLSLTRLVELPASIGELDELQELNLHDNAWLTALPDSIGELSSLRWLSLVRVPLEQLPDSIGQLLHLEVLDIGYTNIATLPNTIGKLHHLESLNIKGTLLAQKTLVAGWYHDAEQDVKPEHIGMWHVFDAQPNAESFRIFLKRLARDTYATGLISADDVTEVLEQARQDPLLRQKLFTLAQGATNHCEHSLRATFNTMQALARASKLQRTETDDDVTPQVLWLSYGLLRQQLLDEAAMLVRQQQRDQQRLITSRLGIELGVEEFQLALRSRLGAQAQLPFLLAGGGLFFEGVVNLTHDDTQLALTYLSTTLSSQGAVVDGFMGLPIWCDHIVQQFSREVDAIKQPVLDAISAFNNVEQQNAPDVIEAVNVLQQTLDAEIYHFIRSKTEELVERYR